MASNTNFQQLANDIYERVIISVFALLIEKPLTFKTKQEVYAAVTKSDRNAKRYGFSKKVSRSFVDTWYDYDLVDALQNGHAPFCKRTNPISSTTKDFKRNTIANFKAANHTSLTSMSQWCRDQPQKEINKSCLSRWMRDKSIVGDKIKGYELRAVPSILSLENQLARLQFVRANEDREWRYTSFSDEGFIDTNEGYNLLKGKVKYYCTQAEKINIPAVLRSKWTGTRKGFSVLVTPLDSYRDIRVFDSPDLVEEVIVQNAQNITPVTAELKQNDFDEFNTAPMYGDIFVKRGWRKKYKKKVKPATPVKEAQNVTAKHYTEVCFHMIYDWHRAMKSRGHWNDPEQKKQLFHFHDNARYFTAAYTQNTFKHYKVPIYPRGDYYGFHNGYPAKSPDFNYCAEAVIGETKRLVALRLLDEHIHNRKITANKLTVIIQECFWSIPSHKIINWFGHQERCMMEAAQCEGGYGPSVKGSRDKKTRSNFDYGTMDIDDNN